MPHLPEHTITSACTNYHPAVQSCRDFWAPHGVRLTIRDTSLKRKHVILRCNKSETPAHARKRRREGGNVRPDDHCRYFVRIRWDEGMQKWKVKEGDYEHNHELENPGYAGRGGKTVTSDFSTCVEGCDEVCDHEEEEEEHVHEDEENEEEEEHHEHGSDLDGDYVLDDEAWTDEPARISGKRLPCTSTRLVRPPRTTRARAANISTDSTPLSTQPDRTTSKRSSRSSSPVSSPPPLKRQRAPTPDDEYAYEPRRTAGKRPRRPSIPLPSPPRSNQQPAPESSPSIVATPAVRFATKRLPSSPMHLATPPTSKTQDTTDSSSPAEVTTTAAARKPKLIDAILDLQGRVYELQQLVGELRMENKEMRKTVSGLKAKMGEIF